jgi:subtilisin family serine protease
MTQGPRRRLAFLSLIAAGTSVLAFGIPLVQSSGARNGQLPQRAFTPVAIEAPDSSVPGQVLVGLRPGVSPAHLRLLEQAAGGKDLRRMGPAIRLSGRQAAAHVQAVTPYVLKVSSSVSSAIGQLRRSRVVAYAEPNYVMHADAIPNDPSFSLQWGSNNTGQSIPTQNAEEELGAAAAGTPAADDNALKAWSVSTGSRSIVIGETDTGINYNHPDLAANIWSNPGGIGGCAAGTHGYNVLTATCEPMDDDSYYGGHGTHVAGIMGAVGNNGIGVAGMNWQSTILPVKWLGSSATGSTSGLIAALQWIVAAKQAGVNIRVVNDSATFWGTAYSQALAEEIETLGANNILFVTAAGNTGNNNDELAVRRYPCGYDLANEICVAASNNNDQLPSWANYGPHTVDLAAPGVSIYSTLRNGSYGYLSGGSMASPQVAGAAALILSVEPTLSATALKADIVGNVDKLSSLAGRVISGGRLDVCNALPGCEGRVSHPASTFGTTTVGALRDGGMFSNYKIVHAATLTAAGSVTKLSLYAVPGAASPSPQSLKAVIYSDSGGSPGALVATGTEVTYNGAVNGSGWFELPFATPVALTPGTYWLGFITGSNTEGLGYAYETVAGSRAYNANSYSSGPTNPFGAASKDSEQASIYATYVPSAPGNPPVNTTLPTISGTAQTGQTLSAGSGTWSESPSSYAYQWQRCNSSGASCTAIAAATAQSYTVASADVGSTLRVALTASNSAGASAPASSTQTALIQQGAATFGKTTVGTSGDSYAANRKRVNRYALPVNGTVSKLSIYLAPTGVSGQQVLEGVIYADASGAPGTLLDVSEQLTFKSTNAAGWYDLTLPTPLKLAAGNYWIGAITGTTSSVAGFRYSSVSGSRDYNTDTYTTGATSAFGAASVDSEQTSLYATYTPG